MISDIKYHTTIEQVRGARGINCQDCTHGQIDNSATVLPKARHSHSVVWIENTTRIVAARLMKKKKNVCMRFFSF